jgi:hypothetical protein
MPSGMDLVLISMENTNRYELCPDIYGKMPGGMDLVLISMEKHQQV